MWQGHTVVQAHPCPSHSELLSGMVGNNYRLAQEWFGTEAEAKQRPAGKWGVWHLTLLSMGLSGGEGNSQDSMVWWAPWFGGVWGPLFQSPYYGSLSCVILKGSAKFPSSLVDK